MGFNWNTIAQSFPNERLSCSLANVRTHVLFPPVHVCFDADSLKTPLLFSYIDSALLGCLQANRTTHIKRNFPVFV